ncbi:MAG TPA: hypothetical protein VH987_03895 [Candidatus Limnocylindria bacterium]|jgi:hypothetical protein
MSFEERDQRLGAELRQLARAIDWPETPELAEAVADRIADKRERGAGRGFHWPLARRGLVLGLLTVVLAVGTVGGIGFALGGLRINFGAGPAASPLPPGLILERAFGLPTDLDTARDALGGTLLLPTDPALGDPDHRFLDEKTEAVALAWGARDGLPADPGSGLSVVITEFRADIGSGTFTKILNEGALIQRVALGNTSGFWIEGGEHFFFFRTADGKPLERTLRLVGNTLMWERDGLTLRIEGAPSLEDALSIAESMQPG